MWNEEQRKRFQELRTGDREKTLSGTEQKELARMIRELEEEEAAYLHPATKRLEQKTRQTQAQNRILKTLVRRQQNLVNRMKRSLEESQKEQQAIDAELQRVLEDNTEQIGVGR